MDLGVRLEVRRLCKGLAAQTTGKGRRPPLLVNLDMSPQCRGLGEAEAADTACEGALARVDAHVRFELVGTREGLGTQGAAVRPFACVNLHVTPQCGCQGEVLATDIAGKGALARVGAQVVAHGRGLEEALATDVADKGPLAGVYSQVALEVVRAQKLLLTDVALVRSVGTVRLPVGPQTAARGIGFATEFALVRRLRGDDTMRQLLCIQPQLLFVLLEVNLN